MELTVENRRFDQCILDWTNQCKSRLPLVVAKSAGLQTATVLQLTYLVQSMKHFSAVAVWSLAVWATYGRRLLHRLVTIIKNVQIKVVTFELIEVLELKKLFEFLSWWSCVFWADEAAWAKWSCLSWQTGRAEWVLWAVEEQMKPVVVKQVLLVLLSHRAMFILSGGQY